jgi:hypothetical protein
MTSDLDGADFGPEGTARFLRQENVLYNSVTQPRDLGSLSDVNGEIRGTVGDQTGTSTLFFKFRTLGTSGVFLKLLEVSPWTDRFLQLSLLDSGRRSIPLDSDGLAIGVDVTNTLVDESQPRLPPGEYTIVLACSSWNSIRYRFGFGIIPLSSLRGILTGALRLVQKTLGPGVITSGKVKNLSGALRAAGRLTGGVTSSGSGSGSGLFSGTLVFSKIGHHAALYIPNPDSSSNTRPLQLPKTGNALTGVSYRNFIYSLFDGDTGACLCNNSGITGWVPVGQTINNVFGTGFLPIPEINQQRFDYSFGAATGGYAGFRCDGQTDYYRTWNGNLSLIFGSFYLQGSYDFCGPANAVAAISSVSGSSAVYDGLGPVYDPSIGANGYSECNNGRNTLVSDTYNIVFGASGRTGTLQFSAQCFTYAGGLEWNSGGTITIVVNPP